MKLYYLTESFHNSVLSRLFEVEHKANRPYVMICVKIDNHLFAVPLRSSIQHPNCYITAKTGSNLKGIDYSKAVIINSNCLNKTRKVTITKEEFDALRGKDKIIASQFAEYVKEYKLIIQKKNNNIDLFEHEKTFIKYSTLQNYHTELVII